MSAWRVDLAACGRPPTRRQALVAWIANPGFVLACHYRLAQWAVARGRWGRLLSLLVERRMIARFACHISARAAIGPGVRFPHPVAIVIGEGVVIGHGATIYQGVTLGRRGLDVADYPLLGRNVVVGCGAAVLGGLTIANGAIVRAGEVRYSEPASYGISA